MQSRMERYQTSEKKKYERTKKNTKLYEKVYDDIYSDTTYKNMSIIDSAKEININKLKNILDDKYDTRQYRNLGNYTIEENTTLNIEQQNSYDINKIIDDAKSKRAFIDEAKEKQKYLDLTEGRNIRYDNRYEQLEKEEQELEELINTMAIPKVNYEESDIDILSDLKGEEDTIVTNPIDTNFENTNEVTMSSTIQNESSKITNKVDKTFYTDSNMFTKNDFEDFSTISKELGKSHKPIKYIIIIIILIIIICGYFAITEFFIK